MLMKHLLTILFFFIGCVSFGQYPSTVHTPVQFDELKVTPKLILGFDTTKTLLKDTGRLGFGKDRCLYALMPTGWKRVWCDTSTGYVPPPPAPSLSILTNPSSTTVTEGSSASFTASATGGSTPYSHQWQKGTTNISGAISGTYTINSTVPVDAGTYRDLITDAASASVTSTAATLTVNAVVAAPAVTYGYSSTDPFVNNTTAPTIGNAATTTITNNADISISFPASAVDKFIVFKVPSTQSIKVTWYSTDLNNGTIPDAAFRAPFTVSGFTYYVTRDAAGFAFDYNVPIQLKQ